MGNESLGPPDNSLPVNPLPGPPVNPPPGPSDNSHLQPDNLSSEPQERKDHHKESSYSTDFLSCYVQPHLSVGLHMMWRNILVVP